MVSFCTRQEKQNRIHWRAILVLLLLVINEGELENSDNTLKRSVTHHVVQVIESIQK